jgi:uncharacterized membrane-anchored protein YitT (DUF2179 family)
LSFFTITSANLQAALSLFIYGTFFAFFSGLLYSIIYVIGGCTAGSDFIVISNQQKSGKNVGQIFSIVNGIFLFFGIFIGTYCSSVITDSVHYSH